MKPTILLLFLSCHCFAQTRLVITGNVFDAKSKDPLPFATIGVKGKVAETISKSDGSFELLVPSTFIDDTLTVTYLGYTPFQKRISSLQSVENIYLEPSYTLLEEVVVAHAKLNIREVDKDLRPIRGNLYAMETEVTNAQYNLFLASLEEENQKELYKKSNYDLSGYDPAAQAFFTKYVSQFREPKQAKDSIKVPHIGPHQWNDYPAVNVSHEGAQRYCNWLTEKYNTYTGKKKFKKVKFRLPTLQEWQIGALGYAKFQTWNLEENMVDVVISDDTLSMAPRKGVRKSIPVAKDVLYPWYGSYHYRKNPRNHMGCFLGNFKVTFVEVPCPARNPGYDGWSMMGRTASYFPNDIGLYDVVGNVAEMIDENGKACGGSWDEVPSESTIHSVKTYSRPDATIGFRIFMEVEEQ
jgi:formylglycine-generating enzyme required for sulfatase activity